MTQFHTIPSLSGRSIGLDITFPNSEKPASLVIFAHGFKGFKDWGYWSLMAKKFADAGYVFLKFNFSFNGTSPAYPSDFVDLTAFGANTFSKELLDIQSLMDWIHANDDFKKSINLNNTTLIGHSRGGGLGVIAAHEDPRIHRLVTWAAVDSLDFLWKGKEELLTQWKRDGVYHILNGRTKQEMPLNWSLVEDFQQNKERYVIQTICSEFRKPMCIIHGKNDPSVNASAAQNLHLWNPNATLYLIDGADHVFGGNHPYTETYLPIYAQVLFSRSLQFLESD